MIAFDLDDFELRPWPPACGSASPSTAPTEPPAPRRFSSSSTGRRARRAHGQRRRLLIIVQGTAEARVGDEVGRLEKHQVDSSRRWPRTGSEHRRQRPPRARDVLRLDRGLDVRAPVRGKRTAGRRHRLARRVGRTPGGGGRVARTDLLAERPRAPRGGRPRRPCPAPQQECVRPIGRNRGDHQEQRRDTTRAGRVVHRHRLRRRGRDAVRRVALEREQRPLHTPGRERHGTRIPSGRRST